MIFHDKDFSKISGDPCWLFIFKEKRCELNFKEMWLVYLIAWWCFLDIFICAALISQSRILWFQYSRRQEVQPIHPKGDQSWCSLEGLMVKLKLQYFGHLMRRVDSLKRPWCWEGLGAGGEGATEDEMAGWHHWLDGHEFEWTPGVGEGQGGLACCDSWGYKESDTTEWLNWTELRRQVGHRAGPKLIYRFISLKILAKFYFCKLNKIILKFISKGINKAQNT